MEVVKFYQTSQGHQRGGSCRRRRRACTCSLPLSQADASFSAHASEERGDRAAVLLATSIKAQTNQLNEAGDHLREDLRNPT